MSSVISIQEREKETEEHTANLPNEQQIYFIWNIQNELTIRGFGFFHVIYMDNLTDLFIEFCEQTHTNHCVVDSGKICDCLPKE